MFNKVKPAGFAFAERFLSVQANTWDTNLANALDGLNGGSYVLLADLILGGSVVAQFDCAAAFNGLVSFGAPITTTSTFTSNSNAFFGINASHTFAVAATALFFSPATFGDTLTTTGNTVLGNASGDTLTVNATSTFANPVTFNGTTATFNNDVALGSNSADTVTVAAISNFNATATFNGNVTLANPVTLSADGHINWRAITGSLSDQSYGINDADIIVIPSGIGPGVDYTLLTTGAVTGNLMRFVSFDTTNGATVNGFLLKGGTGLAYAATFMYFGGAWTSISVEYAP